MPIEDANEKLFKIINPIGVVAGLQAGVKPFLAYALENNTPEIRKLVLDTYEFIDKITSILEKNHSLNKMSYTKENDTKIGAMVVQATEMKISDSQTSP